MEMQTSIFEVFSSNKIVVAKFDKSASNFECLSSVCACVSLRLRYSPADLGVTFSVIQGWVEVEGFHSA